MVVVVVGRMHIHFVLSPKMGHLEENGRNYWEIDFVWFFFVGKCCFAFLRVLVVGGEPFTTTTTTATTITNPYY